MVNCHILFPHTFSRLCCILKEITFILYWSNQDNLFKKLTQCWNWICKFNFTQKSADETKAESPDDESCVPGVRTFDKSNAEVQKYDSITCRTIQSKNIKFLNMNANDIFNVLLRKANYISLHFLLIKSSYAFTVVANNLESRNLFKLNFTYFVDGLINMFGNTIIWLICHKPLNNYSAWLNEFIIKVWCNNYLAILMKYLTVV